MQKQVPPIFTAVCASLANASRVSSLLPFVFFWTAKMPGNTILAMAANFDVWIGHAEDVQAWDLLWDAREAYSRAEEARAQGRKDAPSEAGLKEAKESLLAAEGSDWCWWFGPEHSTANDAEFDALYRRHLTGIYR